MSQRASTAISSNHLRRSTLSMPHRASVVLPLTRHPGVMRALRHPWLRLPQHPHTANDH
ncbi:hypothetical protein [Pseudomonas sp. C27(2019)]|uniref:hypothetical protein n=1 Tax=Pseudomonas sp. C27(2019) TaxID=2604941 RepID=UPI0015B744CB|nr:hypothetical protein [Pseudomonas sp. C27(2019)]